MLVLATNTWNAYNYWGAYYLSIPAPFMATHLLYTMSIWGCSQRNILLSKTVRMMRTAQAAPAPTPAACTTWSSPSRRTSSTAPPASPSCGAQLARGGSVIKCPSPLHVLKDTYDHGCYGAQVNIST